MSKSDAHDALASILVMGTLAASFLLTQKLKDNCQPKESETNENIRQAIMGLSGVALALALLKVLLALPVANRLPWVTAVRNAAGKYNLIAGGYHLLALVVVVLNLIYVSTVSGSITCSNELSIPEAVSERGLINTVTILSILSLVVILKRGIWHIGGGTRAVKENVAKAAGPLAATL